MSTIETGHTAEELVADYLKAKGYTIIARNWKNRWCEIDIVASKDLVTHFVEVKYRGQNTWGDGLDYITPAKLKQMQFAAELYGTQHSVETSSIMAAAVDAAGTVELQEVDI